MTREDNGVADDGAAPHERAVDGAAHRNTQDAATGSDAASTQGLGKRAVSGALVTMLGQILRIGIQSLSVVVLTYLISPDNIGRVAALAGIIGIADVLRDFGLSSAAVQAKELSRAQRNNLFWANVTLGAILTTAMYLAAPTISDYFNDPLTGQLAQVMGFIFLLNGITTQFRAHLNRSLRFGPLAAAEVISQLVGVTVGVLFAWQGAQAWALVAQQISVGLSAAMFLGVAARWLPGLPSRGAKMGPLLKFGGSLVASQIIGYLGNNIEKILIAKYVSPAANGLYDRGYKVLNQPLAQLRGPTTSIALPVLSKLQDKPAEFGRFVISGQVALGYTLVAGLALACAGAKPIVDIIFPDEYAAVAYVLLPIAATGAAQTLAYVGYWVFLSQSLTRQLFWWTIGTSIARIVFIVAALPFGLLAIAWAGSALPLIAAPLSIWWLSTLTPLPVRELLLGYARIFGLAVLSAAAGWYGGHAVPDSWGPWAALAASSGVVVLCYGAAMALPWYRNDLRAGTRFVAAIRHRKSTTTP